jgi:hypothetical protein
MQVASVTNHFSILMLSNSQYSDSTISINSSMLDTNPLAYCEDWRALKDERSRWFKSGDLAGWVSVVIF